MGWHRSTRVLAIPTRVRLDYDCHDCRTSPGIVPAITSACAPKMNDGLRRNVPAGCWMSLGPFDWWLGQLINQLGLPVAERCWKMFKVPNAKEKGGEFQGITPLCENSQFQLGSVQGDPEPFSSLPHQLWTLAGTVAAGTVWAFGEFKSMKQPILGMPKMVQKVQDSSRSFSTRGRYLPDAVFQKRGMNSMTLWELPLCRIDLFDALDLSLAKGCQKWSRMPKIGQFDNMQSNSPILWRVGTVSIFLGFVWHVKNWKGHALSLSIECRRERLKREGVSWLAMSCITRMQLGEFETSMAWNTGLWYTLVLFQQCKKIAMCWCRWSTTRNSYVVLVDKLLKHPNVFLFLKTWTMLTVMSRNMFLIP